MEDVLRSRGIFRITSRKETKPTDDDKKIKWTNRCDEARGLIGMSIVEIQACSRLISLTAINN